MLHAVEGVDEGKTWLKGVARKRLLDEVDFKVISVVWLSR